MIRVAHDPKKADAREIPAVAPADRSGRSIMASGLLHELLAYWRSCCQGDALPRRADIDPTDIPRLLPYLLLTEVLADGRYRYRLVGTEVERSFGTAMTGRHIDELMYGDYRSYIEGLYRRVVAERQPIFSGSRYGGGDGGGPLYTERVMLPLSNDGAAVDMVLSAQIFRRAGPLDDRTAYALQHTAVDGEDAPAERDARLQRAGE